MWKTKYEDLATWCKTNNKEYIINEWHPENPFKPEDVTPFSKRKVLFICPDCGKEYSVEVATKEEEQEFLKIYEEVKKEKW